MSDAMLSEMSGTMIKTLGDLLEKGVCADDWEGDARCLEDPDVLPEKYCILCQLRGIIYHTQVTEFLQETIDNQEGGA